MDVLSLVWDVLDRDVPALTEGLSEVSFCPIFLWLYIIINLDVYVNIGKGHQFPLLNKIRRAHQYVIASVLPKANYNSPLTEKLVGPVLLKRDIMRSILAVTTKLGTSMACIIVITMKLLGFPWYSMYFCIFTKYENTAQSSKKESMHSREHTRETLVSRAWVSKVKFGQSTGVTPSNLTKAPGILNYHQQELDCISLTPIFPLTK